MWPLSMASPGASTSRVCWDDCWEGASWLPPEAREEAAGLEVVDLGLTAMTAAAPAFRLAPGSSRPASRHIADS